MMAMQRWNGDGNASKGDGTTHRRRIRLISASDVLVLVHGQPTCVLRLALSKLNEADGIKESGPCAYQHDEAILPKQQWSHGTSNVQQPTCSGDFFTLVYSPFTMSPARLRAPCPCVLSWPCGGDSCSTVRRM